MFISVHTLPYQQYNIWIPSIQILFIPMHSFTHNLSLLNKFFCHLESWKYTKNKILANEYQPTIGTIEQKNKIKSWYFLEQRCEGTNQDHASHAWFEGTYIPPQLLNNILILVLPLMHLNTVNYFYLYLGLCMVCLHLGT